MKMQISSAQKESSFSPINHLPLGFLAVYFGISVANRQNPFPFLLVKLRNGALKFLVYFSLVCLGKYPKAHEK